MDLFPVSVTSNTLTSFLPTNVESRIFSKAVWQDARLKAVESLNSAGHVTVLPKVGHFYQHPTFIQDFPEDAHKNYVLTVLHGNQWLRSIALLTPDGGWIVGNTPEAVLTQLFITLKLQDHDENDFEKTERIELDRELDLVSVSLEVGKHQELMLPMTYTFFIEPISRYLDRCVKLDATPSYVHVFFNGGGSAITSAEVTVRSQGLLTI